MHILCLQNCCADKFALENVLVAFSNVSFVGYFSVQAYKITASFFETGAMAAPTKLENPTFLGQGVPASALVYIVPSGYTLAGFTMAHHLERLE